MLFCKYGICNEKLHSCTKPPRPAAQLAPFDAAISAGNVITYVAPGTEVTVLSSIRRLLQPDAPYVLGFHVARYSVPTFDADLVSAGFVLESRFSTWDLRPWSPEAEFAVSVLRNPSTTA